MDAMTERRLRRLRGMLAPGRDPKAGESVPPGGDSPVRAVVVHPDGRVEHLDCAREPRLRRPR